MASLERGLRKKLENAVKDARRVAEAGARAALGSLGVGEAEPPRGVDRALRNRLRAHGRQLGDRLNVDDKKGTQTIERLVAEHAYEHWHRLLFARFLAENDLLVEPESGMPLSLPECQELARERKMDWLLLASDFAQRMLPQIFRKGDPVLEVALPPEKRQEIEEILESLPREIFVADDSLGWVYQFWQAERKDAINKSGEKIGAEELPAVTQLFTEDYMVLFLLHNTLGAWWAGKILAKQPELAKTADDEDELRKACALPGVDWSYLRFVRENDTWRPAAGTFDGWPKAAKDITVLDPCMGSGHFLVFALPILAAMRAAEEGLSTEAAVVAVLGENLFGLEIDPRCTQIAAFNLALAAWQRGGYRPLPRLSLACSGLTLGARESDWLALAGGDARLQTGMKRLYELFQQAPLLGSLVDPRVLAGDLIEAGFDDLAPLFQRAMSREGLSEETHELAVAASGLADAARIMSSQFTLVVTNVPFLTQIRQEPSLRAYAERHFPDAKNDLAMTLLERIRRMLLPGASCALVLPHHLLFLVRYERLRRRLLAECRWDFVAPLGAGAFETIGGEVVNVVLLELSAIEQVAARLHGLDLAGAPTPTAKAAGLRDGEIATSSQALQLKNPDARILLTDVGQDSLLQDRALCRLGVVSGDGGRWIRKFWEIDEQVGGWRRMQSAPARTTEYSGLQDVIDWSKLGEGMLRPGADNAAFGHKGVAIGQMGSLPAALFAGDLYDNNVAAIVPNDPNLVPALWAFCSSNEYSAAVRAIDKKVGVIHGSLVRIRFDIERWQRVAEERFPNGLPKPHSDDPTQWLFSGHPRGSDAPLQVAVARLLGYRWPRQTGPEFMDCPALGPDGLESHADDDGILCLTPARGEAAAEERLRALLAAAYGAEWSPGKQHELLAQVGYGGKSLDDWLRNGFFENHLETFHNRPFVLHVWDGRTDGFNALVNYHRLVEPNGGGRRTLDKLAHTYLGDWIDRQRAEQRQGVEGADGRVAAAEHLKRELEKILEGEPPYDLFVRWKPLAEQALGWDPDINDGVRINLRPFMTAKPLQLGGKKRAASACILRVPPNIKWDKDRGKEPQRAKDDYPWFWTWDGKSEDFQGGADFDGNRWNDLHYTRKAKLTARERAKGAKP